MYAQTTILGTIGKDPEIRYTSNGRAVTNLDVATSETVSKQNRGEPREMPSGWKESQNGRNYERTTWYRVTVWGPQAESCAQYLSKGRQVFCVGEMTGETVEGNQVPRVWEGSDGISKASFEMTARTVKFIGGAQSAPAEAAAVSPPGWDG